MTPSVVPMTVASSSFTVGLAAAETSAMYTLAAMEATIVALSIFKTVL